MTTSSVSNVLVLIIFAAALVAVVDIAINEVTHPEPTNPAILTTLKQDETVSLPLEYVTAKQQEGALSND